MLTVDCPPAPSNSVTDPALPPLSSFNQEVYTRLKLALGLNLRGQIFIAVCDHGALRKHLAAQLQADVNQQSMVPCLDRITLHLANPNILHQVSQWLAKSPIVGRDLVPGLQILGIEQLSHEPVQIQRAFLEDLKNLGKRRPTLPCNLILWVSRPWRRSIQQSVPEFWRWHTAVFEFEGDPTPAFVPTSKPERVEIVQQFASAANESTQPLTVTPTEVSAQLLADPLKVAAARPHPSEEEVDLANWVIKAVMQAFDPEADQATAYPDLQSLLEARGIGVDHPSLVPLHLMQELEDLYQQSPEPELLGTTYRRLGDWYRSQVEQGQASVLNLTITIRAYEQVMRFLDPTTELVPELLNDIGNLYWMLSRCPDSPESSLRHLEQAIAAYQDALGKTDPQTRSQSYAMIQNNLGSAYGDLARHSHPVTSLQGAIKAYQSALQYRSAEEDAARYAATQNNLGTAYWNLAQHEQPTAHLQQAIAAYSEALRYYDPEQEALHFAMIQNNLGTAYWNLAQCRNTAESQLDTLPEDLLRLAIGAYRIALCYRTLEVAPAAYAATQNNLGTAYWHLANCAETDHADQREYLQQAIGAYREALSTARYLTIAGTNHAPSLTFDIFATHNNLGLACHQFGSDQKVALAAAERSEYLEAALHHHIQAHKGWEHSPDLAEAVVSYMAQTVRSFYACCGLKGQTQALSQIPPNLLASVMKQL
jgi:tetratricopeptide (TPR) repeat protein